MKLTTIIIASLASMSAGQAAVLYYQDFTSGSPSSNFNGVISDNTLIAPPAHQNGEAITGGSAATLTTNGDYTLTLSGITAQTAGYIFNDVADAGFDVDDGDYTFTTGNISFTTTSGTFNGTVSLFANVNSGGEFVSLNSVEVFQDDVSGEVYVDVDYNFYLDTPLNGGNDDFELTTTFGTEFEATALDVLTADNHNGSNLTGASVHRFVLVSPIPEPSSGALLGLGGLALITRRKRS